MSTDQTTITDALTAWRNWRKAEAFLNRTVEKLDNWTPGIGQTYEFASSAEHEARRLAWRLLDAASLMAENTN